jgi:hypothetical protein
VKELITPAAILIGSVIIGAGLYFGLQGQGKPPEREDPPPSPRAASVAPPAAPPAVAVQPGLDLAPPAAPAEAKRRATEEAQRALEAKRVEIVKACWDPSFKKNPSPPKAKYLFDVSFDPQGNEIARGISDVRGMERPDTGQCLREQPMGLRITPPGVYVSLELEWTLP